MVCIYSVAVWCSQRTSVMKNLVVWPLVYEQKTAECKMLIVNYMLGLRLIPTHSDYVHCICWWVDLLFLQVIRRLVLLLDLCQEVCLEFCQLSVWLYLHSHRLNLMQCKLQTVSAIYPDEKVITCILFILFSTSGLWIQPQTVDF